jgi:hypothetical protein
MPHPLGTCPHTLVPPSLPPFGAGSTRPGSALISVSSQHNQRRPLWRTGSNRSTHDATIHALTDFLDLMTSEAPSTWVYIVRMVSAIDTHPTPFTGLLHRSSPLNTASWKAISVTLALFTNLPVAYMNELNLFGSVIAKHY